jgi:HSP20 family protein
MATMVRWQPFRDLALLQNELSRFMNVSEGDGRTSQSWIPALDVWETDAEVVYALDLPGIPQDKISVELDDGALTVSAERELTSEVNREQFHRFERRYGTFARTIGLPQGVTEDAVRAEFEDGVLEVHVRKPEQPKPRRIQIGSDSQATIEGESKQGRVSGLSA